MIRNSRAKRIVLINKFHSSFFIIMARKIARYGKKFSYSQHVACLPWHSANVYKFTRELRPLNPMQFLHQLLFTLDFQTEDRCCDII